MNDLPQYVMVAIGFANGQPFPYAGQYLKAFDFEAYGGRGEGVFTTDYSKAMKFKTQAHALEFWRTQSRMRPLREDGQPNRPLTCTTVQITKDDYLTSDPLADALTYWLTGGRK